MYVHRRCVLEGQEIDFKKKAHGYCSQCGNQGTIYHVIGTLDHYLHKRQGVTYSVTGDIKEEVNVTLSYDEIIAPSKEAVEGDLTEEIEAIQEVAKEAETVAIDGVLVDKRRPDKTELEAKSDQTVEKLKEWSSFVETPLEAKSEVKESLQEESPEETAPAEGLEPIEEEVVAPSPEEEAAIAKNAKIARLEAELAKLTSNQKQ